MKLKCFRCGHTWYWRVEKPAACPACKSYKWSYDAVKREYVDQTKDKGGRNET